MKKTILLLFFLYIVALPAISGPADEIIRLQDGHTDTITAVLFSPDSQYIATAANDFTVHIWDFRKDRLLVVFPFFQEIVSMQFSPDSRYFAACTGEKILLWDIRANKIFYPDVSDFFTFTSIAFTGNSTGLIVAGLSQNIKVINLRSLQVTQVLDDSEDDFEHITCINLTPDKKNIIAAGDRTVKRTVWRILMKNLETGALIHYEVARHNGWVKALSFSPDASLVASAAFDGRINFFNTGEKIDFLMTLEEGSKLYPSVSFVPGKKNTIAFLDGEGKLRTGVLKRTTGDDAPGLILEEEGTIGRSGISAFAFSPDAAYLATARGNRLDLWQNGDFRCFASYSGERERFFSLAISPDGKTLAAGGRNIILRDCSTGKVKKEIKNEHAMNYRQLQFINNSTLIARKEAFNGRVTSTGIDIINTEKGSSVILPAGITIAFSMFRQDVIALSRIKYADEGNRYSLEILKLGSNESVMSLEWGQRINALTFSGDGKTVAGGCADGTVRFWKCDTGEVAFKLDQSSGPVIALQYSPDSQYLAYSDTGGLFYLWDVRNKEYIKEEKYHYPVTSLSFSPDSSSVLVVCNDAVYNVACYQKSKGLIIRGHSSHIYMSLFSPDGKKIITTGKDGAVKWWNSTDGRLLATSIAFPSSYLIYSPEGYYETSDKTRESLLWYYNGFFLKGSLLESMNRPDIIARILAGKVYKVPEKEIEAAARQCYPEQYAAAPADPKGPAYTANLKNFRNTGNYGKKYAILIGISDYKNLSGEKNGDGLADLMYADKDAEDFRDFLIEQKRLGEAEWNISCLTNEEATSPRIDLKLSEVLKEAKENDLIFIFFSGHARKHPSTGDLYLLTYDFRPEYNWDGLAHRNLNALIADSKARYIITFIDACFSGYPGNAKGDRDILFSAIDAFKFQENKVIIASSRGEELSHEDSKLGHGVFSYYLLKGLRGEAKELNGDEFVNIDELINYLDDVIPAHTRKGFRNQQHPNEFGVRSEIKYAFPLVIRGK